MQQKKCKFLERIGERSELNHTNELKNKTSTKLAFKPTFNKQNGNQKKKCPRIKFNEFLIQNHTDNQDTTKLIDCEYFIPLESERQRNNDNTNKTSALFQSENH